MLCVPALILLVIDRIFLPFEFKHDSCGISMGLSRLGRWVAGIGLGTAVALACLIFLGFQQLFSFLALVVPLLLYIFLRPLLEVRNQPFVACLLLITPIALLFSFIFEIEIRDEQPSNTVFYFLPISLWLLTGLAAATPLLTASEKESQP